TLVVSGLEDWLVKNAKGVRQYAFDMELGGFFRSVAGRENEPYTVVLHSEDVNNLSISENCDKPVKNICIQSFSGRDSYMFTADLTSGETLFFNQDGRLTAYRKVMGKDFVWFHYGADGILSHSSYDVNNATFQFGLFGKLESAAVKVGNKDYYYDGAGWTQNGEACDAPKGYKNGFGVSAEMYPEDALAMLKKRAEPVSSAEMMKGDGFISSLPPMPSYTDETMEGGGLRLTITGLRDWGVLMMDSEYTCYSNGAYGWSYSEDRNAEDSFTLTVPSENYEKWVEYYSYLGMYPLDVGKGYGVSGSFRDGKMMLQLYMDGSGWLKLSIGENSYLSGYGFTDDGRKYSYSYSENGERISETITQLFLLDGMQVLANYLEDGTLDYYNIFEYDEYGNYVCPAYDADGNLMRLNVIAPDDTLYSAYSDFAWYDMEMNPCGAPKGFEEKEWVYLDVSKLEPAR
ncbi:MAG: hypothetical protein PHI27_00105, partial [Eubacteriales bacterium]|nr:hypothetical protein [Eubacteriales bacterium]